MQKTPHVFPDPAVDQPRLKVGKYSNRKVRWRAFLAVKELEMTVPKEFPCVSCIFFTF